MPTLVDCPESSRGEWSFHLFGVAVHVKFWFWITLLLICGERAPGETIIWIAVCFVSILLHEFGHVFAFRFFGVDAEAILYGFGGLAVPRRDVRGTFPRFVVALAGPMAGFGLAALALGAARFSGATVQFGWHLFLPVISAWPDVTGEGAAPFQSTYLWYVLLNDLLFVNFYWGLVNLLPVYPLDGGHAARAVLEQRDPGRGRRNSLILSILVAASVALFGLMEHSMYMVVMFGILAFSSVQALDAVRQRPSLPNSRSWRG
jgi:Zn-dependent protease